MRNPICPSCEKEMSLISTRSGVLVAWSYKCECGCISGYVKHSGDREIHNISMKITYKDEMEG